MNCIKKIKLASLLFASECSIGGQAVIEGVMMRSKDRLSIAIRKADGDIVVNNRPWFTLVRVAWLKKPFLRGFPLFLEILVNGIRALNFSAIQAGEGDEEIKGWHLVLTMIVAIAMALGLFVVLPHLFSLGLTWFGLSGDLETLSFHAWDGFFKFLIFLLYIIGISFLPDIKRVFQYHGAEHKVIWAFENLSPARLDVAKAKKMSRLHPRCGTTFLIFVLVIAIIIHAFSVPAFLLSYTFENPILKHTIVLIFKLLLMIPISALAYEAIRWVSRMNNDNFFSQLLKTPGYLLQLLTTREPDDKQLEVALVALKEALNEDIISVGLDYKKVEEN